MYNINVTELLAYNYYSQPESTPINQRIIYLIIAGGQPVRTYADYKMALQDVERIRQMKPNLEIADPIPIKFFDNRTTSVPIGFNVRTGDI